MINTYFMTLLKPVLTNIAWHKVNADRYGREACMYESVWAQKRIAGWETLSWSSNFFLTPAHLSVFFGSVHRIARWNWNMTSRDFIVCLVKWSNLLRGKMGSFKLPINLILQSNLMTFLCVKLSERMPSWSLSVCLSILFTYLMLQADIWWDFL